MDIERLDIPAGRLLHPEHDRFLTASRLAVAAGMSEWMTPLQLYLEMTGARPRQGQTALQFRGIAAEPMIEAYVRREFPDAQITAPRAFFVERALRIGCTPDREMTTWPEGNRVNLEFKLIGKPAFDRLDGKPPADWQLQLAGTAMLGDFDSSTLAALVISNFDAELVLFDQDRHPAAEARILELAADWWHRIDNRLPPAADYRREPDLVKELNPVDINVPVPLDLTGDNRIIELLEDRERHKATKKAAVASLEAINAEIVEKLHGAALATARGWRIKQVTVNVSERVQAAYSYSYPSARRVEE